LCPDPAFSFQSFRAHHADVHPRNRQNAGAPIRRGGNIAALAYSVTMRVAPFWRTFGMFSFSKQDSASLRIENEFSRKIRREMLRHTNRPHTRTAAAVRNAKRFVQIQMTNVCAVIA